MIVFDLRCDNGHNFEGWFEDGQVFEDQKNKGLIACPVCNDISISKVPSTFAIKSSQPVNHSIGEDANQNVNPSEIASKIFDFVEKNFEDVGINFTREALKIHYNVSEPRNIRGISTKEDEKILQDEGVKFLKFPIPISSDLD